MLNKVLLYCLILLFISNAANGQANLRSSHPAMMYGDSSGSVRPFPRTLMSLGLRAVS